jgi:hypothetical protein
MSAMRLDDRHDRSLELAALALDFGLSAAESSELEAHLAACPSCARRVTALRADARSMSRPLTLLPSARVDEAVYRAIAHRHSGLQRVWLLAAAALLLLAMLGAVAVGAYLLQRFEALPTTDITPTQPVAEASPDPDVSPAAIGEIWASIPFDDAAGGLIEAVTFAGADLVGVGRGSCVTDSDGAGECVAAAWTTRQGEGWIRTPGQAGLQVGPGEPTSGPETGIFDLASGPAGLVAIGYDNDPLPGSCPVAPCTSGPAVWRSQDGQTWQRAQVDFGPGFIDSFSEPITAIGAGPDAYVMVGYALGVGPSGDTEARATAWASPDGVTWTRANDSEDLTLGGCVEAGQQADCGGMRAVAAMPSGFVAVGYRYAGGEIRSPAAWTSPDGLTWTLTMAGLDFEGDLASVTVGPAGVVAGGTLCSPQDCHGTSAVLGADGNWTVPPANGQAMGQLNRLATVGDAMFGLTWTADVLELWQSDDGQAWRRVEGLPSIADAQDYRAVDLAASPDRLIVAGWAEVTGEDTFRNFAYSSPPTRAPSPTATVAPGPTPTPQATVPASDLRWQKVGAIAGATVTGVVGFDDGYVAFGNDDTIQFSLPMAWFSSDARSWEPIGLSNPVLNCPGWGPEGDEFDSDAEVRGAATDGQEVLIVGEIKLKDAQACANPGLSYRGLTWISSDGRTWERSEQFGEGTRATEAVVTPEGWRALTESGAWTSADGRSWQSAGPVGGSDMSSVHAQAVGPDGTLLVAGRTPLPAGEQDRAVLMVSVDGEELHEIPAPEGCPDGAAHILPPQADGRATWVIVPPGGATTCVSADLEQWEDGTLDAPADFGIHALTVTRYGILASGTLDCIGCPFEVLQYLSADGVEWSPIDAPQEGSLAIADGPAGVIGVGGDGPASSVWALIDGRP